MKESKNQEDLIKEAKEHAKLEIARKQKEFWESLEEEIGKEKTDELRIVMQKFIDSMVKYEVRMRKLQEELKHIKGVSL